MKNIYFTQHFRATRPYYNSALVRRMLEQARARGIEGANEVLFRAIIEAAEREGGVAAKALLANNFLGYEGMASQSFAQLEADGTPLYDMDPLLLEALANSDTGDIQLADIRTVNRTYYLHWGPQNDLLLNGLHPVEGALVTSMADDWRIGIVARTGERWLMPAARDNLFLRFPAETQALPFADAVDKAIALDQHDVELALTRSSPSSRLTIGEDLLEHVRATHAVNAPVLKRALMLVGNCMAYLGAYPEDDQVTWQPDTPKSMLDKVALGGKTGARSQSKLTSMGYLQVHRVGLDFHRLALEAEKGHLPDSASGRSGPKAHWRRGHWRHQAHGPEMSLRKLRWIQPLRVLGGASPRS